MNTELLQRLSKAAPEFIQDTGCGMFRIGILEFGESKSGRLVEVIKGGTRDVEWQLFGAICERIEAEGWSYMLKRTIAESSFYIDGDGFDHAIKGIGSTDTNAAALALCEALEAKAKPVCSWVQEKAAYYPAKCNNCGYIGCSCDWHSEPIGMTGDYSVTCPKCYSEDFDEYEDPNRIKDDICNYCGDVMSNHKKCEACGYTECDKELHGDHHLCDGIGKQQEVAG